MRRPALALALAAACAACFPPPQQRRERTDPSNGGLFISLHFKGVEFPYFLSHIGREAWFQRVLPDGSLDPQMVPADWSRGDRVYALDLPPGKYRLVAGSYFTGRTRQLARFHEAMTHKWTFEVKPGVLLYAGDYLVRRPFPGFGEWVLHGLKRFASVLPPFKRAVVPVDARTVHKDDSTAVEIQALQLAREDLAGTFWREPIDARLTQLGDPPPKLMEGTFRKHPVPRKRAETFTWIDTLEWGEPRKVDGGLEWRRPKGRAWVSVTFVPKDGPGARPLDEELSKLRETGAPEDSHTLSEVRVSSRAAYGAINTTYLYPQASLTGSEMTVLKTEVLVVPVDNGFYRLQYRALAEEFQKWKADFWRFCRYLDLAPPPPLEKGPAPEKGPTLQFQP